MLFNKLPHKPSSAPQNHWVYILNCANNTFYTGYTTDVLRRYAEHVSGSAKCKYTRSFKPVSIAQCWEINDKSTALKIEKFIKKMSKQEKEKLILQPERLATFFHCKPGKL